MTASRDDLRKACLALLDRMATPHPCGHTDKAGRYLVHAADGAPVAVMIERNERSPVNLWVPEDAVTSLTLSDFEHRRSPAATLWTKRNEHGEPLYGRHSNLRQMPQLAKADLICFTPRSEAEARIILYRVWAGRS